MATGTDDADRTLADRARRGDREALAMLYESHKRRLLGFLRRLAGHGAEDVFQETWMKVMTTIHQYAPDRGPFRAWLYRIASNTALDRLRSVARRRPAPEEVLHRMPDPEPDPERRLAAVENERRLEALLAGIDPRQRTAILLHHQIGLTYSEIGAALGVAEGTAKTLVHRGIVSLRRRGGPPS